MDQTLVRLEYTNPDRQYLEAAGWIYQGSEVSSAGGDLFTSYFRKDGIGELVATRLAVKTEIALRRRTVEIPPDVAAMKISRQRKLQIAWKRLGLCEICGDKRDEESACYCPTHREANASRQRKRRRSAKMAKIQEVIQASKASGRTAA